MEPASQFGRALKELGVELLAAHSPQAKGRVERLFKTLQDRLIKGLRLAGIAQGVPKGDFERFVASRRGQTPEFLVGAQGPGERFDTAIPSAAGPYARQTERSLDPVQQLVERNRFLSDFEAQQKAEDLARAGWQQEMQRAEIDPRELARQEILTEAAKAN